MAKELYLYYPIYDFVAQEVISGINDNMGKPCVMRVCSPGGRVRPAWGIFKKTKEHGNIHCKVDGGADSIMAFYPMYAKTSECLNTSKFVFHRADMFVENDEDQKWLNDINNDLKAQMKIRINGEKWKAITGVTIDELFDPTTRKDYVITGPQAVEIGLCDACTTLTPAIQQEIEAFNKKFYQVAATTQSNPTKMTLAELQEKHPELYTAVKADLKKEVSAEEKDRIGAWMVFYKTDPEGVAKGIESGEKLSATKMAELTAKMVQATHLKDVKDENAGEVKTGADKNASADSKDKEEAWKKSEPANAKRSKDEAEAFDKELTTMIKNKV